MSGASRVERCRDDAASTEVFTDEEHDHVAESAREGKNHIEAAAIEKDYVAPPRTARTKEGRRAGKLAHEDQDANRESEEADHPEDPTPSDEAPKRANTLKRSSAVAKSEQVSRAINAASNAAVSEVFAEDDTDSLSSVHGGYGIARRLEGRLIRRTSRDAASSAEQAKQRPRSRTAGRKPSAAAQREARAVDAWRPGGEAKAAALSAKAKAGSLTAKIAATISAALPATTAAAAAAAAVALVCAVVVAVLSFSWFWDDANKRKTAVDLPPGCEALRSEAEAACSDIFGNADWSDMVLAIMAVESGGDLNVVAAGGATYVYCAGGCGTPLSSVRQDVMQASECGYGGIIVHGAVEGGGVRCCPAVGSWPYKSVEASTAKASIYAGTLYLRDGLEMWGGYLGEIGVGDVDKLALVAQGYNYNMSSWFAWCRARGITEYSLEASKRFQETLPNGFKGTANHAQKVMAYYPYGHGSASGNEAQATLAQIAAAHATNDIYYQQYCARWVNDMYELAFGPGTCARYPSAWLDWCANGVSSSMDDIPLGAAVYGSGWGYPGMGQSNPYGHVGIYVGDGRVADYSGVHDLASWASQQSALCNGHVGWLGWGWISSDDLSKH